MLLENLSPSSLHEKLVSISLAGRKLTLELLRHLREFDRRRLYAERGHSSLFEYVVEELKYSESSGQRRIFAMRALDDLPELEEKIESGELKVTQLAQIQSFLRLERKSGKRVTISEKRSLIESMLGKSTRETERILAEKNPRVALRDQSKIVAPNVVQVIFTADDALMAELEEVRDRFAHRLPAGASLGDVIRFLARSALASVPEKKRASDEKTPPVGVPAPVVASRYIPAAVQREVWIRDEGRCAYVSEITGKRCGSRHRVQIDHIRPYSLGGRSDDPENLRLLCFTHNQSEARRWFGGSDPPSRSSA
jgi:hypothetical protein